MKLEELVLEELIKETGLPKTYIIGKFKPTKEGDPRETPEFYQKYGYFFKSPYLPGDQKLFKELLCLMREYNAYLKSSFCDLTSKTKTTFYNFKNRVIKVILEDYETERVIEMRGENKFYSISFKIDEKEFHFHQPYNRLPQTYDTGLEVREFKMDHKDIEIFEDQERYKTLKDLFQALAVRGDYLGNRYEALKDGEIIGFVKKIKKERAKKINKAETEFKRSLIRILSLSEKHKGLMNEGKTKLRYKEEWVNLGKMTYEDLCGFLDEN